LNEIPFDDWDKVRKTHLWMYKTMKFSIRKLASQHDTSKRSSNPNFKKFGAFLAFWQIFVQKTGFFSMARHLGLGAPSHKRFAFLDSS